MYMKELLWLTTTTQSLPPSYKGGEERGFWASQVTIYTNFDGLEIQSQEQSSPPQTVTTIWANIVLFFNTRKRERNFYFFFIIIIIKKKNSSCFLGFFFLMVYHRSNRHAAFRAAQLAFKDLMIHRRVQFTLRIASSCVLHRSASQDIHCQKLCLIFFFFF